jgi:hypothetical protein
MMPMHVNGQRAALHPSVQALAYEEIRIYLVLPRLDPADYRKWQQVQYEIDGKLTVIPPPWSPGGPITL